MILKVFTHQYHLSYFITQSTLLKLTMKFLKKIFPSLSNLGERFYSNNKEQWLTKFCNKEFDVPMVCVDGAENCELVCIYILHLNCEREIERWFVS